MRLLLIDPVTTAKSLPAETRRRLRQGIGYPGLGLFTVAALTPRDFEIKVVDESVQDIGDGFDPDLVGISVQAPTAPYAYELSARYRGRGVPVVLGGIHVSLNPDEAVEHSDAIVIGEAELTWPKLIEDFRRGKLGTVYRAEELADLDASPPPRRDLMRLDDYQIPHVVQASKGCPFGCEFCSLYAYVGYRPRFRRIDRVIDEIRALPGDNVLFADDNIYASKEYARQLFRALAPLRKSWVAESTWHIAFDDETLTLAKQSGCAGLFIGFDSINQQPMIRKVPRSGDTQGTYTQALRNIVNKGMAAVAAFVFGLDNDDTSVFAKSFEVVRDGGASLVNFSVLVPYPGTPVFERFKQEGRISEWDWSKYISPNVCFEPKQMSAAELYEGTFWAQREFFALPHVIKTAVRTSRQLGWGRGLLALKLNLAQRRNWGKGSNDGR
jgi:radical SAM superfamily enzyme YgiQ (UPF0313 family)